jgi:hypothetical protein
MDLKLPFFYKRLLVFFIVIGPIYWLVFTDDGQRRSDIVMLLLWGEDEIALNLKALEHSLSEREFKVVYPDLDWHCQEKKNTLGERICVARIGVFNGIPSHYISALFQNQQISSIKVGYRRHYHGQLKQHIQHQLGAPHQTQNQIENSPQKVNVLQWASEHGIVILKAALQEEDEAALLWLPIKPITQ